MEERKERRGSWRRVDEQRGERQVIVVVILFLYSDLQWRVHVCVCVHACVPVCVYVSVCEHVCMHMHAVCVHTHVCCVHERACTRVFTHVYMCHVCTRVFLRVRVHACEGMRVSVHVCAFECARVCGGMRLGGKRSRCEEGCDSVGKAPVVGQRISCTCAPPTPTPGKPTSRGFRSSEPRILGTCLTWAASPQQLCSVLADVA